MITARKCRNYATACELRASSTGIPAQTSLEQSIMALNWAALADEIDREDTRGIQAAFSRWGVRYCLQMVATLGNWPTKIDAS